MFTKLGCIDEALVIFEAATIILRYRVLPEQDRDAMRRAQKKRRAAERRARRRAEKNGVSHAEIMSALMILSRTKE